MLVHHYNNCTILMQDFWESLGLQGGPTSPSYRRSVLGVHWKDWCWGWNSSTLVTSWEELIHWKRPWCWEGLGAGGEGGDRGWDGWMASPTQWTRVWINSRSWWWTGRPGVLWFMGSQRVGHNWTEIILSALLVFCWKLAFIPQLLKMNVSFFKDGSGRHIWIVIEYLHSLAQCLSVSGWIIPQFPKLRSIYQLVYLYA